MSDPRTAARMGAYVAGTRTAEGEREYSIRCDGCELNLRIRCGHCADREIEAHDAVCARSGCPVAHTEKGERR